MSVDRHKPHEAAGENTYRRDGKLKVRTQLRVALGAELYEIERPWGILPKGTGLSTVSSVAVDSQDRVYVCQRDGAPVVVFDASGNYLRSFGHDVLADPHGLAVGRDDALIVVDRDAHEVLVFDPDGCIRLALGARHRPSLQSPFNHPTDAAVAANGDIYVADGYGNSCVHWFSADGDLKGSWGRPGVGTGEFSTPHAIWVDRFDRVLVADRENNRIQLFTLSGEYVDEWSDFYHPMDIFVDTRDRIYVTDQIPRISMLSEGGVLEGRCRPVLYLPHGIWGDSRGNLYIAETSPMDRITRLARVSS